VLPNGPGPPTLAELDGPPRPLARASHRPLLDGLGQSNRDDDGTLMYEYDGQ